MASSTTTGRFWIAPMPRIATFGWLMIGRPISPPKTAGIGDREGALLHLFGLQFFGARALGQIVDGALQAQKILLVGVLDHRHDQAPVQRHGDADVDLAVQHHVGSVQRGIHRGEVAQRLDAGAHEKRHEGELGLVALLELVSWRRRAAAAMRVMSASSTE